MPFKLAGLSSFSLQSINRRASIHGILLEQFRYSQALPADWVAGLSSRSRSRSIRGAYCCGTLLQHFSCNQEPYTLQTGRFSFSARQHTACRVHVYGTFHQQFIGIQRRYAV